MKRNISIVLLVILIFATISGCSNDGRIRVPKSASECKDKDYLDVKALFESAGFTNVSVNAIEDLVTGWITKDGAVERVSINGDDNFGSLAKFDPSAEVVVTYHTFPSTEDNSEEIEKPEPETTKDEETNNEMLQKSEDEDPDNEVLQKTEDDEYSNLKSQTQAYRAVKKYGEMVYKYGIEYDRWSPDSSEEYEGNGVWHIRLAAKCTNQYGAVENVVIDARVDFIKEAVTEFNVE